ncbi:MAG: hypothetical protein ACPG4U_08150 [Pseudomonadales bacterium]
MQSLFFRQTIKFAACTGLLLSYQGAAANELRTKYNFEPSTKIDFQTAVIPATGRTLQPKIEAAIVDQNIDNVRLPQSNVQVVAAVNYPKRQPPAPVISYSYIDESENTLPEPVVVAVSSRSKAPLVTPSSSYTDRVTTFVVGLNGQAQGYHEAPKTLLDGVNLQIEHNRLTGCAEISVNCTRTATHSSDAAIERSGAVDKRKKRQVLTP